MYYYSAEKFSCTCMCTMGDAQLQARKTRAFFQPELSFKCCLFFLISSNRHGSRFHKLYEQEKKIRNIHNFLVKIKSLNLYQLRIILYSIIIQKWKSINLLIQFSINITSCNVPTPIKKVHSLSPMVGSVKTYTPW